MNEKRKQKTLIRFNAAFALPFHTDLSLPGFLPQRRACRGRLPAPPLPSSFALSCHSRPLVTPRRADSPHVPPSCWEPKDMIWSIRDTVVDRQLCGVARVGDEPKP